ILASILTYFLVQDLPKEYKSTALISTGLADQSQRVLVEDKQTDYFVVTQQFNNIIEFLTMKKNINILSYKLILHDLENPGDTFSSATDVFAQLDSNSRGEVIQSYRNMLAEGRIITPEDNQKYPLFDYLQQVQYDEGTILKNLEISREEFSDFVNIQYTSNDPHLSVYVVNTIANDFVDSYTKRANYNQNSLKEIIDSLLLGKEHLMNV